MITNELLEFIAAQLEAGVPREEVEHMLLLEGGWEKADVEEAFRALGLGAQPASTGTVSPGKPVSPVAPAPAPAPASVPAPETGAAPIPAQQMAPAPTLWPEPAVADGATADKPTPSEPAHETRSEPTLLTPAGTPIKDTPPDVDHEDFLGLFSEKHLPESVEHAAAGKGAEAASTAEQPLPRATYYPPAPQPQAPPAPAETTPQFLPTDTEIASRPETPETTFGPIPPIPEPPPSIVKGPAASAMPGAVMAREGAVPAPKGKLSAAEWSLQYMLAKAATARPDDVRLNGTAPSAPVIPPAATFAHGLPEETEGAVEVPQTFAPPAPSPTTLQFESDAAPLAAPSAGPLSPEERLFAEGAQPQSWKDKEVGSASTAELWLARGGKTAPAASLPILASTPAPEPLKAEPATVDAKTKKPGALKWVMIGITVLVVLVLAAGGVYLVALMKGGNKEEVLAAAITKFFAAQNIAYEGVAHADLALSGVGSSGGVGTLRFDLGYDGEVAQSARGFGDGDHHFHLAGGLESGTLSWQSDLDVELRVLGRTLYVHTITPPRSENIDPDLMKAYWIKVDLGEIANELGVAAGLKADSYGQFGTPDPAGTFMAVFRGNMPFALGESLPDEVLSGVNAHHYRLKVDPVVGLKFVQAIYRAALGKELALTEDESVRMRSMLEKLSAEVWVGAEDGALKKFTLSGDLDDALFGVRTKGPFSLSVAVAEAQSIAVAMPTSILTLEEIRIRMDEYTKSKGLRAADQERILSAAHIAEALDHYKKKFGRYPDKLTDLVSSGILGSAAPSSDLARFGYYGYTADGKYDRAARCSAKAKTCPTYHLGVNLSDITNPALAKDADQGGDISGDDARGCGKEKDAACYDLIPTTLSASGGTDAGAGDAMPTAPAPTPTPSPAPSVPTDPVSQRDARRIGDITRIASSLASFHDALGKYPLTLTELLDGYLDVIPHDPSTDASYAYLPLSTPDIKKAVRCDNVKINCAVYYLGASLEKKAGELASDNDYLGWGFKGLDATGCKGEKGRYCYDITP